MPELVLGGAQLGLLYGVSNKQTQVISVDQAQSIMHYARRHGIHKIDTASAYGNSEHVIGTLANKQNPISFDIITKTPPLSAFTVIDGEACSVVDARFYDSLKHLQQKNIYGLMVHHAEDLLKLGSERLFELLLHFKKCGYVKKIGCSFYSREDLENVLARYPLDIIQVPVNIFDQRLLEDEFLLSLNKKNIEIYARSILLQGLIFLDEAHLPANIREYAAPVLKKFNAVAKDHEISAIELALAFFKDKDYLSLVIGVTTEKELSMLVNAMAKINKAPGLLIDFKAFAVDNPLMLNPSLWKK